MNVEKLEELLEELRKCDKEARAVDRMLTTPDMAINVFGPGGAVEMVAGAIREALVVRQGSLSTLRAELVSAVKAL